jgi:hypothetical protein
VETRGSHSGFAKQFFRSQGGKPSLQGKVVSVALNMVNSKSCGSSPWNLKLGPGAEESSAG